MILDQILFGSIGTIEPGRRSRTPFIRTYHLLAIVLIQANLVL
ncbi:hypothetical protein [Microcoleus sp. LEGE 07076]|nr:hypothetical protein [Microcoleus sp. LEGE 07076]